jgi:hypothetical protein
MLAVSRGELVNIFELVELSLEAGVSDKEGDDDIEALDEAKLDSRLVADSSALGETLCDPDLVPSMLSEGILL